MSKIPKITALIITKNEEKFIRDFIISMDFVDEIIIVDSFSTDNTIAIAKEFPRVKIIQRVFDGFSNQKNFAIDQATNDWILFFDGDEILTPELRTEIVETLKTNNNHFVAFNVYRTTIYMNREIKYSGWQNDKVVRLFNKNYCKYNGKLVHEKIIATGKVGVLKHKIRHYSYKGFNNIIQKRNLYAGYQAQELYLKGFKPNFFHFLFKPIGRFFKHFILKLGFLDGIRGFIISYVYAYSVFVRYVKLWLLRKNIEVDESKNNFPIDAVITWVDGSDAKHQEKMKPFYKGKNDWKNKKFRTRFDQVNEIEYAVKSIVKFAPYIRNIFIVTDEQTPSFLASYNKNKKPSDPTISVVDHKVIFAEFLDILPVFNCRPIETLLYKIPEIAEHFIYFNDDFSLFKESKSTDFFNNGLPILRGKWTLFDENKLHKKIYNKVLKTLGKPVKSQKYGYKRGQQNAARALGFKKKYFRIDHTPAPMRKSTLANYYKDFPEMQIQNVNHRFRNPVQYVLQSMANHIEIKNQTYCYQDDYQLLYIGGSFKKPLSWYKNKILTAHNDENIKFLCLQSLDYCPKPKLNYILGWLDKHLSPN